MRRLVFFICTSKDTAVTEDIVNSSEFYRNACVCLGTLEVSRDLTAGTCPEIQPQLKSYSDLCVCGGGC